jgi:hypothetical protein
MRAQVLAGPQVRAAAQDGRALNVYMGTWLHSSASRTRRPYSWCTRNDYLIPNHLQGATLTISNFRSAIPGVAAAGAAPVTRTLGPYEQLELLPAASGADITGLRIDSTTPVAVASWNPDTSIPLATTDYGWGGVACLLGGPQKVRPRPPARALT